MGLDDLWRQKLEQELKRAGGPTELAAELELRTPKGETIWSPNFLSQLRSPSKSFGKKVAAQFEARLGKSPGWMNVPIEPPEPERQVSPEKQFANDVLALQMAVQSLVHVLTTTIPVSAQAFAGHLEARAKKERFSDLRGIVASAIDIARQVERRAEAAALVPARAGSGAKGK